MLWVISQRFDWRQARRPAAGGGGVCPGCRSWGLEVVVWAADGTSPAPLVVLQWPGSLLLAGVRQHGIVCNSGRQPSTSGLLLLQASAQVRWSVHSPSDFLLFLPGLGLGSWCRCSLTSVLDENNRSNIFCRQGGPPRQYAGTRVHSILNTPYVHQLSRC